MGGREANRNINQVQFYVMDEVTGQRRKGHGRLLWMSVKKTDGWQSDRSFQTEMNECPGRM